MSLRLKKLADQVVVITGATSGIGLATARLANRRRARLVLVARDQNAVEQLARDLCHAGREAIGVAADVADEQQMKHVAQAAVSHFGGFDTWINNAGTSIYGHMTEIPTEDHRRLFEINFWGVVYGSLEAARHFRGKPEGRYGNALINIGSVLSDRAVPVQGMYSATKHAVKGFTDALRMELEMARVPVSVTLVKPSSIDTPFPQHARNYMDQEPTLPPPLYTPELVAKYILHCAETPERDVTVGGGGKGIAAMGSALPRLTDYAMEATVEGAMKKGVPPRNPAGTLNAATGPELRERGDYSGPVLGSSVYSAASLYPSWIGLAAVGAGIALAAGLFGGASRRQTMPRPPYRSTT